MGEPFVPWPDVAVYDLPHATGEPCAVVDLLCSHFGERVGMILLWNFTCFPFDDATAWEQAKELVRGDPTTVEAHRL